MKRELMMLHNLNCPTCAMKLEAALGKMQGVSEARVSFASGTLDVRYDNEKMTQDDITGLVRRFGLDVTAVVPGGATS